MTREEHKDQVIEAQMEGIDTLLDLGPEHREKVKLLLSLRLRIAYSEGYHRSARDFREIIDTHTEK